MPISKSYSQLVPEINNRLRIVIHNVAKQLVEQLRLYLIKDFYNAYAPTEYNRTHQFRDDAPSLEMLTDNIAKIFIDTDKMNYNYISGSDVAALASLGFHGNTNIFAPGYYWSDFIDFCDKNVPDMLKTELIKQGFSIS